MRAVAFAIAVVGLGCGGPDQTGGAGSWWNTGADPCPMGAKLVGSSPPPNGRPSIIVVGWYERACMDGDEHEGPAVTYWGNGKPFSAGSYHAGLETGTWRYYYDTGQLFAIGTYTEGIAQPSWTYYQLDGKPTFWEAGGAGCPAGTQLANDPAVEPAFEYWCEKPDHTKHGPYASWRGFPGWLFTQYVDGAEDGTSTRWGEDRIRHVHVYDHGWHVSETSYYGDHPFEYTESVTANGGNGSPNGRYTTWYPDGAIQTDGSNHNNLRDGVWTYHDPTGTPVARATFKDGAVVARDDLWHCVDAKHLLRAADLGGDVKDARIAGEAETAEYSTVELTGHGKRAALRLWKSNFDDSQNWFLWVRDQQMANITFTDDEPTFAWWTQRGTYHGDPAIVFMDIELGAVELLTCPKPACRDMAAVVALAEVVHHRLLYDRWCVDTIE